MVTAIIKFKLYNKVLIDLEVEDIEAIKKGIEMWNERDKCIDG